MNCTDCTGYCEECVCDVMDGYINKISSTILKINGNLNEITDESKISGIEEKIQKIKKNIETTLFLLNFKKKKSKNK